MKSTVVNCFVYLPSKDPHSSYVHIQVEGAIQIAAIPLRDPRVDNKILLGISIF